MSGIGNFKLSNQSPKIVNIANWFKYKAVTNLGTLINQVRSIINYNIVIQFRYSTTTIRYSSNLGMIQLQLGT